MQRFIWQEKKCEAFCILCAILGFEVLKNMCKHLTKTVLLKIHQTLEVVITPTMYYILFIFFTSSVF